MQSNQVLNSGNELDFMPNLDLITIFQGVAKLLKETMHLEHTALLYIINGKSLFNGALDVKHCCLERKERGCVQGDKTDSSLCSRGTVF